MIMLRTVKVICLLVLLLGMADLIQGRGRGGGKRRGCKGRGCGGILEYFIPDPDPPEVVKMNGTILHDYWVEEEFVNKTVKTSPTYQPVAYTRPSRGLDFRVASANDSRIMNRRGPITTQFKTVGLGVPPRVVHERVRGPLGELALDIFWHRYTQYHLLVEQMSSKGLSRLRSPVGLYEDIPCEPECDASLSFCMPWGVCRKKKSRRFAVRPYGIDTSCGKGPECKTCYEMTSCSNVDKNLYCHGERMTYDEKMALTRLLRDRDAYRNGVCKCRRPLIWNEDKEACVMFVEADCSRWSNDSPPSQAIQRLIDNVQPLRRRPSDISFWVGRPVSDLTKAEALAGSLLVEVDPVHDGLTRTDLDELFCRDTEAFLKDLELITDRPAQCPPLPARSCAMLFDSHDCSAGWQLEVPRGARLNFYYFSKSWKYRNDADVVGVKAGCAIKVYSGIEMTGVRAELTAHENNDAWWVLEELYHTKHMANNILSLECTCNDDITNDFFY